MTLILLFIIILEFFLIYFLSRQIFSLLFTLFYLPLKHLPAIGSCRRQVQAGQTISNTIISLLFLPGTIIHEFSHALVAKLLGAQVHEIMLYPHKDKETGELKAGSCEIERVDPFRLSLIGIAPSLIGVALLCLSVSYLYDFHLPSFFTRFVTSQPQTTALGYEPRIIPDFSNPYKLLLLPLIFIISATMFTSKRDLREFLMVVPAVGLIAILLYYAGFRVSLSEGLISFIQKPLAFLAFVLGFTLIIELLIYIFLFVPVSLLLSLLGKKLK